MAESQTVFNYHAQVNYSLQLIHIPQEMIINCHWILQIEGGCM